jgi:hypothetical protein
MIEPSEHTVRTLQANGAPASVIETAVRMTDCLRAAGDDVADSTGEDLFDDKTSRGFLLYRRGRNRMIAEFADDESVEVSTADNALHVLVDAYALSFYSARGEIDHPSLDGTSRTKRNVVDEMQLQIEGLESPAPRRLVLMHQVDEEGLLRADIGVLRSGQDWDWHATMYDRIAPAGELSTTEAEPGYEYREEPVLPPIQRRADVDDGQRLDQQHGS